MTETFWKYKDWECPYCGEIYESIGERICCPACEKRLWRENAAYDIKVEKEMEKHDKDTKSGE